MYPIYFKKSLSVWHTYTFVCRMQPFTTLIIYMNLVVMGHVMDYWDLLSNTAWSDVLRLLKSLLNLLVILSIFFVLLAKHLHS